MSVPCNPISLLYVDDEPGLLDIGKIFLEREGEFTVFTVTSAKEALEILAKRHFEAIISDYQMPEMDGIELLKNIRSHYPDLPFIIFTGKGREEVVIQAIDGGADYYVQKGNDIRPQFRELSHKIKLAVAKRQIEKALKASEERFRNVVEDLTEFICRFTPDGILTFVNEAYCRYFSLDKSSCTGAPYPVMIPLEDLPLMKQHLDALTPENPVATIEHRIVLPTGELRWQHWSDRAIFDVKGTIIEYQSVGHDITYRKTAELNLMQKNEELHAAYEQLTAIEEELRTSYDDLAASQRTLEDKETTLDAILQESPIPQFVIDRDHKILSWNHALARYSGIAADEVIGTDQQWRAFYPSKRPCLADLLLGNEEEKIPEWYADRYAKSDLIPGAYEATDFFPGIGKEGKWLHFTAGLIKNRNGEIIGAVESLEDITDRKNAELDLMKKNEELRRISEQRNAR